MRLENRGKYYSSLGHKMLIRNNTFQTTIQYLENCFMRLKKFFFLPSIADMLFLSIFIYLSFSKGLALLGDGDTGYHIRAGEWILSNLSVPRYDMFSFLTPPLPWTAHEWLSEVIMALIHGAFGLTGLVIFFSGILALVSMLLFRMLRRRRRQYFSGRFYRSPCHHIVPDSLAGSSPRLFSPPVSCVVLDS